MTRPKTDRQEPHRWQPGRIVRGRARCATCNLTPRAACHRPPPVTGLATVYTLLVSHDTEHGNDEGLDEAMEIVRGLLTPEQLIAAEARILFEYAGSGYAAGEDD